MIHYNLDYTSVGRVIDAYEEKTDLAHSPMLLKPIYVSTQILLWILAQLTVYALHAINHTWKYSNKIADLSGIDIQNVAHILQTLYVSTGCDYISFFSGNGKSTFLRYFFQHASFITGANAQGSLADTDLHTENYKQGFLAFLRLVGTIYYKKHASAFDYPSPATHFLQFVDPTPLAHHTEWIDDVRQHIADRSMFDNDMLPTTDALFLHWKRSCWVLHMWAQADRNTMDLKPLTEYGWNLTNNELKVTWDTEDNITKVRQRVSALLKGCKCTTGCKNKVCGCKKRETLCSEGCQCTNCENINSPSNHEPNDRQNDPNSTMSEEEVASDTDEESDDEDDFADFVFAAACCESDGELT